MGKRVTKEAGSIVATGTGSFVKAGLAGLGPAGAIAVQALNDAESRSIKRRIAVIEHAITSLAINMDQLKAKLNAEDELSEFWSRVLDSAAKTRNEKKLEGFANILSAATSGEKPLIEASLYYTTLDKVDNDHVTTLTAIKDIASRPATDTDLGFVRARGAPLKQIAQHLSVEVELAQILLNDLSSAQLVHTTSTQSPSFGGGFVNTSNYLLTDFGEKIWGFLADAKEGTPDSVE